MENLKEFVNHISRVNGTLFWFLDVVDEAEKQLVREQSKSLARMPFDTSHTVLFTKALSVQMARNVKRELPNAPGRKALKQKFDLMLGSVVAVGSRAAKVGVVIDEGTLTGIFKGAFEDEGVGYLQDL